MISPDTALAVSSSGPLLDIPDCDQEEWFRDITRDERARVREIFDAFAEMRRACTLKAGAHSAAMKRFHLGWGWSAKSLLNLYSTYRKGGHKPGDVCREGPIYQAGDWRILLRTYAGKESRLPPEFVRWLNEQFSTFKGRTDCVRALWRHVVHEIWLVGKPIPGYGTIDEWSQRIGRARPNPLLIRTGELPEGWHERTWRRYLPQREVIRQQLAHGYLAAHTHQPDQVLTDRSPLRPLEYVYLDDSRPDFRCTYFGRAGRGEIVYPLLVLGLDACSGVDVANVTKPRALKHPEAENEAERRLRHGVTQDMADAIVIETLRRWGVPPWGITFVHENAAACISSHLKHALRELYGDKIRFEATGIFNQRMAEHGFGESGGAPYDKAPIEAFWRIVMTQIARLPGSTGPRYDSQPGELEQIEKYTLKLMDKAGHVADVFKRFSSPLLDFMEADAALQDALRLLRFRTNHALQGFDRVREWRETPGHGYRAWADFLTLPVESQNAVATGGDKHAIVERLECPAERFCRLLAGVEMTPVNPDLLTWLEGPREKVRVRDGKITVNSVAHGDDELIFREPDHPLLGPDAEGAEYESAIARDGGRIVLTQDGRVLGHVLRQDRVVRGTEEWNREAGRVAKARCADRVALRGYLLLDTEEAMAALRTRNAEVAATITPTTPKIAPAGKEKLTTAQTERNSRRAAALAQAAQEALSDTLSQS